MNLIVTKERATRELEKFLSLLSIKGIELNMPNSYIDEVWHSLLNDKKEYSNFCDRIVGKYVNHVPNEDRVTPIEFKWVYEYEKKYGRLDISWFITSQGEFRDKEYEMYIKDGVVKMSWDCGPITEED